MSASTDEGPPTTDDGTSSTVSSEATEQTTGPTEAPVAEAPPQTPEVSEAPEVPEEAPAAVPTPEPGVAAGPEVAEHEATAAPEQATDAVAGTDDPAGAETSPAGPAPAPAPAPPAPHRPGPPSGGRATPAVLARPRAPRPGAPRPQAPAVGAAAPSEPAAPAGPTVPVRPASDPSAWGRVDEAGTVFVRTADGEREVGSEPGSAATGDSIDTAAVLAPYGIRFDDLVAQVDLVEQRLTAGEGAPADAVGTLRALRSSLATAPAVGDLESLAQRTRDLEATAGAARAAADAERAAVREAATAAREEVVSAAEAVAATDPAKMQWRPAGERLKELLETWKELQRSSRLDKRTEDEMWKRFSGARTAFDRARRAHFSALEGSNAQAKTAKTALVVEAEGLVTSQDWGTTAQTYKRLMDRWRTAGHAGRRDDDALWARFRAAQDAFFAARHAAAEEEDASYAGNLVVKEELLSRAEALLPVRDQRAARRELRDIGELWEAAGKVPRAALARVEGRLRAVESAVADSERETWRRADPEKSQRASGAVAQLERAVAQLDEQLRAAEAAGDQAAAGSARAALEARQGWLDAARATAREFSG